MEILNNKLSLKNFNIENLNHDSLPNIYNANMLINDIVEKLSNIDIKHKTKPLSPKL